MVFEGRCLSSESVRSCLMLTLDSSVSEYSESVNGSKVCSA